MFAKTFFIAALSLATSTTAMARPSDLENHDRSCSCFELDRRIQGLDFVMSAADEISRNEIQNISLNLERGQTALDGARKLPYRRQEAVCSRGLQELQNNWVRWQAWISEQGADIGNRCEH